MSSLREGRMSPSNDLASEGSSSSTAGMAPDPSSTFVSLGLERVSAKA